MGEPLSCVDGLCSYDLDLDKKLSEETTVLVENYTVSRPPSKLAALYSLAFDSCRTDESSKSAQNDMRLRNA